MLLRTLLVPLILCLTLTACDSAEEKAQAYYERGMELLAEGDTDRAKIEFRNAIKEVPTMIEPRLEMARLNQQAGDLRPALRDYVRIAEQEPDHVEANIALGEISFLVKDWDAFDRYSAKAMELAPEAPAVRVIDLVARYRTAVDEKDGPARSALLAEAETLSQEVPDSAILRQILIDGYLSDGRYADALVQLDKTIEAEPTEIQPYMLKLQVLTQLGDDDATEAELRRMVEMFPEEKTVQANLLRFLVARDKVDDAEAYLRDRVAASKPGEDSYFFTLIQFLLQLRGPEVAMAELDSAIQARPDAYQMRSLRSSLRFDSGEHDEAISEMQTIVDEASAATDDAKVGVTGEDIQNYKVTLATMLREDGNEVGARRLVEEILESNPEVVGALKMQARWMIADDDTDGAINAMRLVLAKADQDHEAMTIMAEAYQRAGKKDLMLNFLSLAADAANNAPEQALRYAAALRTEDKALQAESALISSLRAEPNNIDVLAALGRIYLELDDISRARQVADTLEKLEDDRARSVASSLDLEIMSRESGSDEAMAHLRELSEQDDGNNGATIALIQAHMQNGESAEAIELIDKLIAENPEDLGFVYFRGLAEALGGDFEQARQTFTELTEKNPGADVAWVQLGRLQTVDGDTGDVLETLDKGLEANPGSPDILWAKASYLQEKGDIDGAIDIYDQLYEVNSSSLVVANNLASLLTTYRDDDESLERARIIARRLQGTDVPALQDTYGWILFRSGDTEEALKYIEPAARGLPDDASVQFHLGEVYSALGRKDEALAQMRLAMDKVGPLGSEALAGKIRERIATLEAAPAEN